MTATIDSTLASISRYLKSYRWYFIGAAMLCATQLITMNFEEYRGRADYMCLVASVITVASGGGYGPSFALTICSVLYLCYFIQPPYHSFRMDFEGYFSVASFVIVAAASSMIQVRRKRAEMNLRRAHSELEIRVEQRTAELAQSRAQLSVLVNGVADQAFFTVNPAGVIASWNGGAERLLGYTPDRIVGLPLVLVLPNVRIGDEVASEEHDWAVRSDGSRIWVSVILTALSAPPGYAVALRDITERRSLERDILEISEREQERIGRDLHDGLGQELTGIAMLSTALAERAPGDHAADAETVAELVHESIRHTRELARGLCPVNLEDDGLAAALELLCQRIDRLPDVNCVFQHPIARSDDASIGEETATHLYRIAQEATTNAIRHGRANFISVRLATVGQGLTLSVTDDGIGFSKEKGASGMGLRLMNYRAKMCRGTLNIYSAAGAKSGVEAKSDRRGTVVECILPNNWSTT